MTSEERKARYRGLRGVVRHLLPKARQVGFRSLGRSPVGPADQLRRNLGILPKGRCLWCGLPLDVGQGRRMWHDSCVVWHAITRGVRRSLTGQWVVKKTRCPCGRRGKELDHRTPVMLAAHRGPREYARAFLPENLQWLCEECHRLKTKEDAAAIAAAKRHAQGQQQLEKWKRWAEGF